MPESCVVGTTAGCAQSRIRAAAMKRSSSAHTRVEKRHLRQASFRRSRRAWQSTRQLSRSSSQASSFAVAMLSSMKSLFWPADVREQSAAPAIVHLAPAARKPKACEHARGGLRKFLRRSIGGLAGGGLKSERRGLSRRTSCVFAQGSRCRGPRASFKPELGAPLFLRSSERPLHRTCGRSRATRRAPDRADPPSVFSKRSRT